MQLNTLESSPLQVQDSISYNQMGESITAPTEAHVQSIPFSSTRGESTYLDKAIFKVEKEIISNPMIKIKNIPTKK